MPGRSTNVNPGGQLLAEALRTRPPPYHAGGRTVSAWNLEGTENAGTQKAPQDEVVTAENREAAVVAQST